jgi:Lon protease-like protein
MFPLGSVLLPGMPVPLHVFEPRYRRMVDDCRAGDGTFGVVLIERGSEVGGGDVRTDVGTLAQIVETRELPDGRWLLGVVGMERIRVERWLPDDPYPRAEIVPWPDELDASSDAGTPAGAGAAGSEPERPDGAPGADGREEPAEASGGEPLAGRHQAETSGGEDAGGDQAEAGEPVGPLIPEPGVRSAERRGAVKLLRRVAALSAELGQPAAPLQLALPDDPVLASYVAVALSPLGPADRQKLLAAPTVPDRWVQLRAMLTDQVELLQAQLTGGAPG